MNGPDESHLERIQLQIEKLSEKNPEEVAGAIRLLDSIWQTAGRDFESQFPELYPDAAPADKRERNKNYWVAKDAKSGEVIGVVGYSEFEGDLPNHAWLGWFCVKKELQGKRHGVDLVNHVIDELKKLGKTELYVQTSDRPTMEGNRKFYDRNDFPVVARMDIDRSIHIEPEAGDLSKEVIKTVVEVNDAQSPEKGITNFIRRRNLMV